jgi:hypothetical protein
VGRRACCEDVIDQDDIVSTELFELASFNDKGPTKIGETLLAIQLGLGAS